MNWPNEQSLHRAECRPLLGNEFSQDGCYHETSPLLHQDRCYHKTSPLEAAGAADLRSLVTYLALYMEASPTL